LRLKKSRICAAISSQWVSWRDQTGKHRRNASRRHHPDRPGAVRALEGDANSRKLSTPISTGRGAPCGQPRRQPGEGIDLAERLAPLPDSTMTAIKVGEVRSLLLEFNYLKIKRFSGAP
jgi:hypothetical protein